MSKNDIMVMYKDIKEYHMNIFMKKGGEIMKKIGIGILSLIVTVALILLLIYGCQSKKYRVTFDTNGGSKIESVTVLKDETLSKPADPVREGFEFMGWYFEGKEFDFNTKINKNIKLIAKWRSTNVDIKTITIDTDGGSSLGNMTVKIGDKLNESLLNTTKEGYELEGWYVNGEKFDFNTPITEDMVLVAKWNKIVDEPIVDDPVVDEPVEDDPIVDEPIVDEPSDDEPVVKPEETKYTVKFDSNGGSKVSSKTVVSGNKVSKPTNPTRSGYEFLGWYLNGSKYNFSTKVTKNITLVAKWEKVESKPVETKYTVKFDSKGGSTVSSKTVVSGNTVSKPTDPTRSGYEFLGWYLNGSKFDFSTKITKNITLVAKWKEVVKLDYKWEPVQDSVTGHYRLFLTKNGKIISGTADLTSQQNKVINKEIPKTGLLIVKDTIKSVTNIKES